MDIISHGLWGGIAMGRKKKSDYIASFLFGISPDLFSFGILFVVNLFSTGGGFTGHPEAMRVPDYVNTLYNITHSLFSFSLVFFLLWAILKKPFLPAVAWLLHILLDIPTHSEAFFPTPFLWPASSFRIDGVSWGTPWVFFTNVGLLALVYGIFFWRRKMKQKHARISS